MNKSATLSSSWLVAHLKERGGRLFILERFSVVG